METLHLTLKKKWFDMILSGEKKEEYREMKDYWVNRFCNHDIDRDFLHLALSPCKFDVVLFSNGYAKNRPQVLVELLSIETGNAKPEWSDNWAGEVFIIKLGNIIKR